MALGYRSRDATRSWLCSTIARTWRLDSLSLCNLHAAVCWWRYTPEVSMDTLTLSILVILVISSVSIRFSARNMSLRPLTHWVVLAFPYTASAVTILRVTKPILESILDCRVTRFTQDFILPNSTCTESTKYILPDSTNNCRYNNRSQAHLKHNLDIIFTIMCVMGTTWTLHVDSRDVPFVMFPSVSTNLARRVHLIHDVNILSSNSFICN